MLRLSTMNPQELHSHALSVPQGDICVNHDLSQNYPESLKLHLSDQPHPDRLDNGGADPNNPAVGARTIEIHLEPTRFVESFDDITLAPQIDNNGVVSTPQMLYLLKSITEDDNEQADSHENSHEHISNGTTVVLVTMQNVPAEEHVECSQSQTKETESLRSATPDVIKILDSVDDSSVPAKLQNSTPPKHQRPKRKAALNNKYISDPDKANPQTEPLQETIKSENPKDDSLSNVKEELEVIEVGIKDHDYAVSETSDDGTTDIRKCVVCLRQRKFTEDIFDSSKKLYFHIDVLIAHLNIEVKGSGNTTGICPECINQLQRWHIFNCAIVKRHETAKSSGEKYIEGPIAYDTIESRIYRNFKKMARVKEVFQAATHAHYARRNITDKDWDFFCDHLFHSNSVKSEKSRELERFITSREKMSHIYCIKCKQMIPNGKKGYTKHMETDHQERPVMYPCDICGLSFPEKDMTASTEDYYPHWISHFYFNRCSDCGKNFPTRRALGQHRHAVHKNRQVKCDKCGKILANKMSLDLHLLRHLPENEKKKHLIKCKICKRKIAQWNIKSHMSTHTDDRPWKCDHCDATFKMKGALVSHRDVVHFNLKNHVCSICNEAFKSASSLRGHVRRHEGRKDYKCDICLKEYYTYSALKGHKIVHQTVRDFVCETCGKAFKKKKALEEHVTIHTGEKPHQCPICGREIRVKSNLYKHMKIHKKLPHSPSAENSRRINSANFIPEILLDSAPETSITEDNAPSSANSAPLEKSPTTVLPPIKRDDTALVTALPENSAPSVHTHQDLLNVPAPLGNYYDGTQYITTAAQIGTLRKKNNEAPIKRQYLRATKNAVLEAGLEIARNMQLKEA